MKNIKEKANSYNVISKKMNFPPSKVHRLVTSAFSEIAKNIQSVTGKKMSNNIEENKEFQEAVISVLESRGSYD